MTDDELEIIGALSGCTFLPGSAHKRFVRDMLFAAQYDPDRILTEPQHRYLIGLRWRYRRQIRPQVAGLAVAVAEYSAHRRRSGKPIKVQTKEIDRQPDLPLWGVP